MSTTKQTSSASASPHHDTGLDVVTGAFSFSGRRIAGRLEANGRRVRTLTGHPDRAPKDTNVDVCPLDFDDPDGLAEAMSGATTLYNTYWVRFPRGEQDHDLAVANSVVLFDAARRAGVQRIVHISITHPSLDSPYPYFRGKARVEHALGESGVSHAIVRPAILFGENGVLLNNIAWLLRRLPVFAVGGDGRYRVRPVHVDDLARLCVELGNGVDDDVVDAVGPERPTFLDLVQTIRDAVGSRARILRLPGKAIPILATTLGWLLRDVLLTAEEYYAMAEGRADTEGPATGEIRVSTWIAEHAKDLGTTYANELDRHFR